MARLYLVIIVLGVLGGVGYGAWQYYNDTQQRIQTLAENNAKLETALETSEKSINAMREQAAQLQSQLKNYKKTYKKQNNTEIILQDLDS